MRCIGTRRQESGDWGIIFSRNIDIFQVGSRWMGSAVFSCPSCLLLPSPSGATLNKHQAVLLWQCLLLETSPPHHHLSTLKIILVYVLSIFLPFAFPCHICLPDLPQRKEYVFYQFLSFHLSYNITCEHKELELWLIRALLLIPT